MREIKFRGKRVDGKGWVYGDLMTHHPHHIINDNATIVENGCIYHEVIPESVGQLWEPSNGLSCYTGDLFTAICSPSGKKKSKKRIVLINDCGRGMSVSVWYQSEWYAYSSIDFTSFQLIGNIQDNPELLK